VEVKSNLKDILKICEGLKVNYIMIAEIYRNGKIACHFALICLLLSCANPDHQNQKDSTARKTEPTAPTVSQKKNIIFFGNSLTAGYGLDPGEAFPALIQSKIDSLGLAYQVINAGLSGETTAGGLSRIDWILRQPVEIFILELGGNDGLRGIPPSATFQNLQSIINRVREKYPHATIILTGIQVPPNMGNTYSIQFRTIFPKLARGNNILLVPFLLQGVGGIERLNQADGIHPTSEGHRILAENVWNVLKAVVH